MKPEIKQKWIDALRSGEYVQGRRALQRDGKFCCLGVLCNLHAKETNEAWKEMGGGNIYYLGMRETLPVEVFTWSGLNVESFLQHELIEANDEGIDFAQIADMIEDGKVLGESKP